VKLVTRTRDARQFAGDEDEDISSRERSGDVRTNGGHEASANDDRLGGIPVNPAEERLLLKRLDEIERELAKARSELDTKTRKLAAAERQITDLKQLIKLRKMPVPLGAPEISEFYRD
jgi:chromosome segregation ATPase